MTRLPIHPLRTVVYSGEYVANTCAVRLSFGGRARIYYSCDKAFPLRRRRAARISLPPRLAPRRPGGIVSAARLVRSTRSEPVPVPSGTDAGSFLLSDPQTACASASLTEGDSMRNDRHGRTIFPVLLNAFEKNILNQLSTESGMPMGGMVRTLILREMATRQLGSVAHGRRVVKT